MSVNLSNFTDEQLIEEIKSRGYKVAGVTLKAISQNNNRIIESASVNMNKKEELIEKFKESKTNQNSDFKSIKDLGILISEEAIKWAIETGIYNPVED